MTVFPAPAGVIPALMLHSLLLMGFPRTCGGDPVDHVADLLFSEFSPHLRG